MAWVSTNETVGSRKAVLNQDNKGPYVRVFQVLYDATVTDLTDVQTATGIPVLGADYPTDSDLEVTNIDPQEVDGSKRLFLVLVTYTEKDPFGYYANPTEEPWRISTDTESIERIVDFDVDTKNAVVNSAGELFDPPLIDTDIIHILNLTKNFTVDEFTLQTCWDYENKINSAPITLAGFTFPNECLWCTRFVTPGKANRNGTDYYTVNIQFKYLPTQEIQNPGVLIFVGGWKRVVIDAGFNELVGGEPVKILNEDKTEPSRAKKLDGAGAAADHADDAFYKTFSSKFTVDFNNLIPALPADLP